MNAQNGDENPPVRSHGPNCWKALGFGGTGLMVLIIILAIVTGGNGEDDGTRGAAPDATLEISTKDRPFLRVESSAKNYAQARARLAGHEDFVSPNGKVVSYEVDADLYAELEDILGVVYTEEDLASQARWKEQFHHYDNLNAFTDSLLEINSDRVIDEDELDRICFLLEQWGSQLNAAAEYMAEYREADPDVIKANPGLQNLEDQANEGLAFLVESQKVCLGAPTFTPTAEPAAVPAATPTPLPAGTVMLPVTVQTRFYGSWEEWTDELRKDPCFVRSYESNGITTTIWNDDCRLNRPAGWEPPYMPFGKLIPDHDPDVWGSWTDADGDCQDTRQEVLISEAVGLITYEDNRKCRVESSKWNGAYTGKVFEDPGRLEIDHIVPLANAHKSGAWEWDQDRREAFFNDLKLESHLIAVEAGANQSKGSSGPEDWNPPLESYWCQYATDWIEVKNKWELTVTPEEADELEDMLAKCEPVKGLARQTE